MPTVARGGVVTIASKIPACCLTGAGAGWGQNRLDQFDRQNRHNRLPFRLWWIAGSDLCRVTFWLLGNHLRELWLP